MRLIDAEALMQYCSNTISKTISNNDIARFPTIEEQKKGTWIPCKKQLPEFPCLVTDAQGNPAHNADGLFTVKLSTGERIAIEAKWVDALGGNPLKIYPEILKANRIIAWMPLPERYQEKEKDNDNVQ